MPGPEDQQVSHFDPGHGVHVTVDFNCVRTPVALRVIGVG